MSPDVRFPKLSVDHFREASKEIDGSLVGGGLGRNVRFRGSFFPFFSFFSFLEVKEGGLLCDFHRGEWQRREVTRSVQAANVLKVEHRKKGVVYRRPASPVSRAQASNYMDT